jgi:putative two-component system response regulator
MQTVTPQATAAPTIREDRRLLRDAIQTIDAQWIRAPHEFEQDHSLDGLLAPLLALAARVPEPGAADHVRRVGRLAEATALAAGWDAGRAAELRVHGVLHDLGKLGVQPALLAKPGPLSPDERRQVQRHAEIGFHLLRGSSTPLLRAAARVAREHHEWWNGGGYPFGLAGSRIDPNARVIAIADVYDALTSARPYRGPITSEPALALLEEGRGRQFDPQLLDAFLETVAPRASEIACAPLG